MFQLNKKNLDQHSALKMEDVKDQPRAQEASGPSITYSAPVFELRKGGNVMLDGRPCKIVEAKYCKDQEGNVEKHLIGCDIFTNKKYEDTCPALMHMDVPIIKYQEFEIVDILDNGYASLFNGFGVKPDLFKIPDGELDQFRAAFAKGRNRVFITVMSSCGEEVIIDTRMTIPKRANDANQCKF